MRTRQKASFGNNLTDCFRVTAINSNAGLQNGTTHHISFKILDQSTNKNGIMIFTNGLFRLSAGNSQCRLTFGFVGNFISRGKRLFKTLEDFFDILFLGGFFRQWARFFCTRFGKINNRINHWLDRVMTKIHRPKHDVFRQLLGFRFNHQHTFMRACHDKIKRGVFHLFNRWIQYIGIIDPTNPRGGDRPKEGNTRQGEGGRGANHRRNIRVVFHIMRQNSTNNLCFAFK